MCREIPGNEHIHAHSRLDVVKDGERDPKLKLFNQLLREKNCGITYSPYLFSHWFRVSDSGAEETIPLQSSIESRPMIVSITSMG